MVNPKNAHKHGRVQEGRNPKPLENSVQQIEEIGFLQPETQDKTERQ